MTHRLALPTDFEALAAITNHYIRNTAVHFGYEEVTADELRESWREFEARYPWIVAEHEREVIGYAKAGTFRGRDAYRWTTETGIYLAPEHCGKGHGQPLYEKLVAVLRAQGFHSAIGGIALPNDVSVRLHEDLGFEHRGTVREAGHKSGRWHDVGFWQVLLQEPGAETGELRTPAEAWGG